MTNQEILSVFRKCFPRGSSMSNEDILYFVHKILQKINEKKMDVI